MHPYYQIDPSKLGESARIPLKILGDSEVVFKQLADDMIEVIQTAQREDRSAVLIVPVGPIGHYPYFVKAVHEQQISLKHVWFFNMDEYLTDDGLYIDESDPLSFRGFMKRTVYSQIHPDLVMPPEQRIFPDPADPGRLTRLLSSLGGADLCIGGIGINGHLAFNEADSNVTPEAFSKRTTRILTISPETRTANAIGDLGGAIEDMPKQAVTIGIHEILSAKAVRLGVFRDWHRAVVRRAGYGDVSAEFPVTLLQNHSDAVIYINDVASKAAYQRG